MATDYVFCTHSANRSAYGKPHSKKDERCITPKSSASIHQQCDSAISYAGAQEDHGCIKDVVDSQKNNATDVISSAAIKLRATKKLLESATQKIRHWQEIARCEKERAEDRARKVAELEAALKAANDNMSTLKDNCEREKRRADQKVATILKPKSILKSCRKKKVSFKVDDYSFTGVAKQASESLLPADLGSATTLQPAMNSLGNGTSLNNESSLQTNPDSEVAPQLITDARANGNAQESELVLEATCNSSSSLEASSISKRKIAKVWARRVKNQPTDLPAAHGILPTPTELDAIGACIWEDYLSKTSANTMAPPLGIDGHAGGTATVLDSSVQAHFSNSALMQPSSVSLTGVSENNLNVFFQSFSDSMVTEQSNASTLANQTAMELDSTTSTNLDNAAALKPSSNNSPGETNHALESFLQSIANGAVVPQQTMDSLGGSSAMDLDTSVLNNLGNTVAPQPGSGASVGLSDAEMAAFIKTFVVGAVTLQSGNDSQCAEPFYQANPGNEVAPHLGHAHLV
ncbi:hypothetical protein IW150_001818 [Coemansia sp. RSA 2607]|nr:hypothetical protein IW150_001818 [Coemansia sp. RSA 2607]